MTPKMLLFLLLLLDDLFVSRAGKWKECDPDMFGPGFTVRGIVSSCFGISTSKVPNQPTAMKTCVDRKAILAEPYSLAVAGQLTKFALELQRDSWIGVAKDRVLGWTFATNKNKKNYTFCWSPTQPTGDGDCVHMIHDTYEWNDKPCERESFAVCHIERDWTECAPNPCKNSATCQDVPGPEKYKCICIAGTTGRNCSEDIDECASSPCKKGICDQSLRINEWVCKCSEVTYGTNCEFEIPSKPEHNCPPFVFLGETLSCKCTSERVGDPPAKIGFLLAADEYTPTLVKTDITTADDGSEYTCGYYWKAGDLKPIIAEIKYKLVVAYGPTDKDTSITGPTSLLTDGESGLTVTLTCSSYWVYPDASVQWEGVQCSEGNLGSECRFTIKDNTKELRIFCTLKNSLKNTVTGKANHTLRIDSSRKSVIIIRILRIGDDDWAQAEAGQSMKLVCEAYGGDPRPAVLEVYHIPSVKDLFELTGGTMLSTSDIATPPRVMRKTYSVKASDICGSLDAYRCEAKADIESSAVVKQVGLRTNCSTKAPEAPDETPVGAIAGAGTGSSLGLLALAFLLWKRRNQAQEAPRLAGRELVDTQEDDDVFQDTPAEAAPTENPTDSAAPEEGEGKEASTEESGEAS